MLRHRYSLSCHHLAVPCDQGRLLSSSHRQDLTVCARVGRAVRGEAGGEKVGRVGAGA